MFFSRILVNQLRATVRPGRKFDFHFRVALMRTWTFPAPLFGEVGRARFCAVANRVPNAKAFTPGRVLVAGRGADREANGGWAPEWKSTWLDTLSRPWLGRL